MYEEGKVSKFIFKKKRFIWAEEGKVSKFIFKKKRFIWAFGVLQFCFHLVKGSVTLHPSSFLYAFYYSFVGIILSSFSFFSCRYTGHMLNLHVPTWMMLILRWEDRILWNEM